jgi:hypothetical protein
MNCLTTLRDNKKLRIVFSIREQRITRIIKHDIEIGRLQDSVSGHLEQLKIGFTEKR